VSFGSRGNPGRWSGLIEEKLLEAGA